VVGNGYHNHRYIDSIHPAGKSSGLTLSIRCPIHFPDRLNYLPKRLRRQPYNHPKININTFHHTPLYLLTLPQPLPTV
jgi:hypothetical protein